MNPNCTHSWNSTTLTLRHGKNRGKGASTRSGFVCSECRLIALPPKSEKRARSWTPPQK